MTSEMYEPVAMAVQRVNSTPGGTATRREGFKTGDT